MREIPGLSELPGVVERLQLAREYVGLNVEGHRIVQADGRQLLPGPSQLVWNHSPDGFNWGYGGSGPAQLALALLLHTGLPTSLAVRLHQDLKWQKVAKWDNRACWVLPGAELLRWITAALDELVAREQGECEGGTDGA